MKKIAFFALAGFFALSVASCKKCVTCSYTDSVGGAQTAESCSKNANDDLESDLEERYGRYGTIDCKED